MTDATSISRILTLVFTDLADSTALKSEHGDRAIGELIARHRAQVRRLAGESGGRIVGWAGDGCFLVFETPSAAVLFALRLQQVHGAEGDLPGVRTGIHMGEVGERPDSDGDVEGLAVDVAARIAGLARPAQILMSAVVADSARPRLDRNTLGRAIRWQGYGTYRLKGFNEPVEIREAGIEGVASFVAPIASDKAAPAETTLGARVGVLPVALVSLVVLVAVAYLAWLREPGRSARPARSVTDAAQTPGSDAVAIPAFAGRPAIAVLPLDNLSPDPEQAFFADGLAEDLITRLSAWRLFPVIARHSSFKYRGGNLDLKTVGVELGARYLVEGSVRRAGDRIRVTAQLVDAPSGDHVWAETYDREVKDVFALQDEISETIAASIVGDLGRVEAERARQRGTANVEAWGLYQMGLQHTYRYAAAENLEARRLFERSLALDPAFATAAAILSLTYSWEVGYLWTNAPDDSIARALDTARRAVLLDPRDAFAQAALSMASLTAGDARGGLDAARRAVDLNPSMPEGWIVLGWAQLASGDLDGCIAANKNAQHLDPQGEMASIAWDNIALAYWETGRFDESLDAARHLLAAHPEYIWGHLYLAMNAISQGRPDDARAAIVEARRLQPDVSIAKIQHGLGVARPEADARRDAALREAGLE